MRRLASWWGLIGVALLLAVPVVRLAHQGIEALAGGLSPLEWGLLALSVLAFGWGEGVLALHRRWVPRVLERLHALRNEESAIYRTLAPMYGMSLIGDAPGRLARGWGLVGGIAVLVVLVGRLPQPARGIVDLGVAVALAIGLVSLLSGWMREPETA